MPLKRSRCRPPAASVSSNRYRRADGVTLVETLIAAAILVVGLLSIAQLLGVSFRGHQLARNGEEAARLAIAKVEQLEKLNFLTDAAIQITPASPDSLTANVANYFDAPTANYTRRWKVAAGPTANTRLVSVQLTPTNGDRKIATTFSFSTIVRSW